jgi:preprotein translocase subunit SecY
VATSELTTRVLFTLGALLVYRVGTYIPLPGIDPAVWTPLLKVQGGALASLNAFAGGALGRLAIFALNLGPYLSAGLLVQIVSLFWPKLRTLRDSGDRGRGKIRKYTLTLTLLLAALQSYGVALGLEHVSQLVTDPGLFFRISTVVTLTGGTFFLVWLSDLITARGIGNGLALILFVGIVIQVPISIADLLQLGARGVLSYDMIAGLAVLTVVLVGFIVFMELARRTVPIEYAERRIGDRLIEKQSSILSFKLNNAGFIPAVVGTWFLSLALLITYVFAPDQSSSIAQRFYHGQPGYIIYVTLAVVFFALLYVALLIDPDDVADKLQKLGGVVRGVEPGEATAGYLDFTLSRTTILGGLYLALLYVIPEVLIRYTQFPFYLGGVSALIIVCTVLDIRTQVDGLIKSES